MGRAAPPGKPPAHHVVVESAGYVGLIAAGPGWHLSPKWDFAMLAGYVPDYLTGEEIWQVTLKLDWHPQATLQRNRDRPRRDRDGLYMGISLIYGHSDALFVELPEQYPEDYYGPTAFRATFNVGFATPVWADDFAFVEFTMLDAGLAAYVKNPEFYREHYAFLGLEGIGSLALGIRHALD